jgi:hypothetical protein
MVQGVPAAFLLRCPKERQLRRFVNVDGGTVFRCSGCEWYWTLGTQAPTGTSTAVLNAGGTAITVASGGASFTSGMLLLYDTAGSVNAEVLTVTTTGTATNIPVSAAVKGHLTGALFGQLLVSPTLTGFGLDAVPNSSPYLSGG